jgi:glycine hydroxymethyltransferase
LGAALHQRGFGVAAADLGYTASHQIAVDVGPHGGGKAVARRLCENGIITNMNLLPGEPGRNARDPRGLRLGVQEMTRYGMGEDAMDRIATLMHDCIVGGKAVAEECRRLRADYPKLHYAFGQDAIEEGASPPAARV